VPLRRRAANPLTVPDHQIAELAFRIQLIDETVGEAGPRHKFKFHLDPGLCREILRKFDECVRRVPRRPAQRQRRILGA
jgi:hypothetical protein